MAIKERRIKCVACGERETVIRGVDYAVRLDQFPP